MCYHIRHYCYCELFDEIIIFFFSFYQVSVNPTGLIRCIAVAPSGYWVALGQASGFLTILDIRTGLIIASWKGHECEVCYLSKTFNYHRNI